MKVKAVLLLVLFGIVSTYSQTLYSERFSGQQLTSYTAVSGSGQYTVVPNGFSVINDGRFNNIGNSLNPNKPFNATSQKTAGWLITSSSIEKDTFLVCTSWLDTATNAVNRWVITPPVSLTGTNLVLKWKAKSPDPNFKDGYEVYFTTSTASVLTQNDFPVANRLFIVNDNNTAGAGENSRWTGRSAFLDNLSGQTVRFAFRNNSRDRFQLWIDDIEVASTSHNRNVAITETRATKYMLTNIQDSVRFTFVNLGATTVFSLTMNYMVGNSSVQSQVYTNNTGWGSGSVNNLKFNFPFFVSSPGVYKIKTWVGAVNGLPDQDVSNDTAIFYVSALNTSVPKTCLMEQFISANDGDSPDAAERLLALQSNTAVIGVNVHHNDSLYNSSASDLIGDFKKSNATALFDRFYFNDSDEPTFQPTGYSTRINRRLSAVSPVSVSVIQKEFNSATNTLSFTVKADFAADVAGNFNIGAYLTENFVYGPPADTGVNGYNQLNNFYHVPWSPFYQKGYYSPLAGTYVLNAWEYRHRHVLIHAFNGMYGTAGSITPSLITTGQSFQQTFTLTLPTAQANVAKYRPDNIYIVAFVSEAGPAVSERSILNTAREKLNANPEVVTVPETLVKASLLKAFPNPANQWVQIELSGEENTTIRVLNLQGAVLAHQSYGGNSFKLNTESLPNGIYFLELEGKTGKRNVKLIVQHP